MITPDCKKEVERLFARHLRVPFFCRSFQIFLVFLDCGGWTRLLYSGMNCVGWKNLGVRQSWNVRTCGLSWMVSNVWMFKYNKNCKRIEQWEKFGFDWLDEGWKKWTKKLEVKRNKKNGKKISVSFYQTKQIQELCISQELDIQIT